MNPPADRILMTGNEAIARGVWEAGCHVASAYPGTPSTEILETLSTYPGLYTEWATNEKVALEVAAGAAMAGARGFAAMKHVGLNVAADPLFTVAYTGVTGALVVSTSDEPGMHSSQNEQDNRRYAVHAKLPLIQPSDSQECLDFTKEAFRISAEFDTPVLLRTTTRVCHGKSLTRVGNRIPVPRSPYAKNIRKNLMIPGHAQLKHPEVEQRLERLAALAEQSTLNRIEPVQPTEHKPQLGIITTGIAARYAKEVFGTDAAYLILGFPYPFPVKLIKSFAASVEQLLIVEENEPFIEDECRRLGLSCHGKDRLPVCGELDALIIRNSCADLLPGKLTGDESQASPVSSGPVSSGPVSSGPVSGNWKAVQAEEQRGLQKHPSFQQIPALPPRPPALCPGCPHRGIFTMLARYRKHVVSTDIGCYTLGALSPLNSGDFLFCMGSSISSGMGFAKGVEWAPEPDPAETAMNATEAKPRSQKKTFEKVFAVIGDSTFFHSGITGLINVAVSGSPLVTIILDNRITAMTGHQENPGTGRTIDRRNAPEISIQTLVAAAGFDDSRIFSIDPHRLDEVKEALHRALEIEGPAVIITRAPCALLPEAKASSAKTVFRVDRQLCIACKACIRTGCPAISMQEGRSCIDPDLCASCGICSQVCGPKAITGPHSRSAEAAHE